jgi:hypothetical protein
MDVLKQALQVAFVLALLLPTSKFLHMYGSTISTSRSVSKAGRLEASPRWIEIDEMIYFRLGNFARLDAL